MLIKAVAGGGGKGMRKVEAAADFLPARESCKREASASFGNDQVLLEKWITSPRHIEVQVFGDTHGNVVHLFERDCSLQRRHQKVIEEAPAPGMDAATREAICQAAVRAAKAVDYVGAGTIEFIADASEGLSADRIFFMEMNTRLQVEHPVTEEITGVDLVEWQLRVASGEELPLRQEELSIDGWAIEARLYAEDPATGFLPSTGRLGTLILPETVRVETGVTTGDEISPFYDPMIAKLIAFGEDREGARRALAKACGVAICSGVKANAWFLKRLLEEEAFATGRVTTGYIGEQEARLTAPPEPSQAVLRAAAAMVRYEGTDDPFGLEIPKTAIDRGLIGFRLNSTPEMRVVMYRNGERVEVDFALPYDGKTAVGPVYGRDSKSVTLFEDGATFTFFKRPEVRQAGRGPGDGAILAPMPGKVIAVDVAAGEAVTKGQRLLVLEAMKMEHALTAPFDGTVAELAVSEGQQVQVETLLAKVEKGES